MVTGKITDMPAPMLANPINAAQGVPISSAKAMPTAETVAPNRTRLEGPNLEVRASPTTKG